MIQGPKQWMSPHLTLPKGASVLSVLSPIAACSNFTLENRTRFSSLCSSLGRPLPFCTWGFMTLPRRLLLLTTSVPADAPRTWSPPAQDMVSTSAEREAEPASSHPATPASAQPGCFLLASSPRIRLQELVPRTVLNPLLSHHSVSRAPSTLLCVLCTHHFP